MKYQTVLDYCRYAGYHGDSRGLVRLICENRVSRMACEQAFREGRAAKAKGVKCHCSECNKEVKLG